MNTNFNEVDYRDGENTGPASESFEINFYLQDGTLSIPRAIHTPNFAIAEQDNLDITLGGTEGDPVADSSMGFTDHFAAAPSSAFNPPNAIPAFNFSPVLDFATPVAAHFGFVPDSQGVNEIANGAKRVVKDMQKHLEWRVEEACKGLRADFKDTFVGLENRFTASTNEVKQLATSLGQLSIETDTKIQKANAANNQTRSACSKTNDIATDGMKKAEEAHSRVNSERDQRRNLERRLDIEVASITSELNQCNKEVKEAQRLAQTAFDLITRVIETNNDLIAKNEIAPLAMSQPRQISAEAYRAMVEAARINENLVREVQIMQDKNRELFDEYKRLYFENNTHPGLQRPDLVSSRGRVRLDEKRHRDKFRKYRNEKEKIREGREKEKPRKERRDDNDSLMTVEFENAWDERERESTGGETAPSPEGGESVISVED